jgi:formylglycine-generating enzyme required for sulfatase activity
LAPVSRPRFSDLTSTRSRVTIAAWLLVMTGCGDEEPQSDREFNLVRRQALAVEQNDNGHTEADLGDGHQLVFVPAGTFSMGSADGESFEQPVHRVFLNGYWIDKFPVTVAQFRTFVADTDYQTDAERGEGCWIEESGDIRYDASWRTPYVDQLEIEPVLCVSWNDAMTYAAWLSARTGLSFNLPTEAQWEKAARGDDSRVYPWGDTPPAGNRANLGDISYMRRFPGRRNPSPDIDDGYVQASPIGGCWS